MNLGRLLPSGPGHLDRMLDVFDREVDGMNARQREYDEPSQSQRDAHKRLQAEKRTRNGWR